MLFLKNTFPKDSGLRGISTAWRALVSMLPGAEMVCKVNWMGEMEGEKEQCQQRFG